MTAGRRRCDVAAGSWWSRGVATRRSCRRTRWSRSAVRRPGRPCFGSWRCIVSCLSVAGRGRGSAMPLSSSTGFRLIESPAWSNSCRALPLSRRRVPSRASSHVVGREVRLMADPRSESAARRSMWQSAARWTRALGIHTATATGLDDVRRGRAADPVNNCCRAAGSVGLPPVLAVRSLLSSLVAPASGGRQVLGQGRRCGCEMGCAWAGRLCGLSCAVDAGGSRVGGLGGRVGESLGLDVCRGPVSSSVPAWADLWCVDLPVTTCVCWLAWPVV